MATQITFEDEHLPVLVRALECFTRLRAGQIEIAVEEAFPDKNTTDKREEIQKAQEILKEALLPALPTGRYLGVGNYGNGGEIAYEVSKTIKHHLAHQRRDKGEPVGGVDLHMPLNYSRIPFPIIKPL